MVAAKEAEMEAECEGATVKLNTMTMTGNKESDGKKVTFAPDFLVGLRHRDGRCASGLCVIIYLCA